jgi:hypothetical protein
MGWIEEIESGEPVEHMILYYLGCNLNNSNTGRNKTANSQPRWPSGAYWVEREGKTRTYCCTTPNKKTAQLICILHRKPALTLKCTCVHLQDIQAFACFNRQSAQERESLRPPTIGATDAWPPFSRPRETQRTTQQNWTSSATAVFCQDGLCQGLNDPHVKSPRDALGDSAFAMTGVSQKGCLTDSMRFSLSCQIQSPVKQIIRLGI